MNPGSRYRDGSGTYEMIGVFFWFEYGLLKSHLGDCEALSLDDFLIFYVQHKPYILLTEMKNTLKPEEGAKRELEKGKLYKKPLGS